MEDDSKLFHNSIKYLHEISRLPEINIPVLKSHLCLKRRIMELRKSIFLPTNVTKPNLHCQKCFLNIYDGPATYKILSKPTKHTFADKILAKQNNFLPLTKYQQKYLKKMKTFSGNQLVTKCKFCEHETYTKINEPKVKSAPKISIQSKLVSNKKKKKNKKDKFCGLNREVVSSLRKKKIKKWTKKENTPLPINFPKDHVFIPLTGSVNYQTPVVKNSKSTGNSEVIYIDSDDSVQEVSVKRKMKKKPILPKISTPPVTISRKKKKSQNKLSELLKNTGKKNNPSGLMDFLKGL